MEQVLFFGGPQLYHWESWDKKRAAVITDIRREQGERNEAIRGRYTYIISYRFTLPDGKSVDGNTRKIGNSVFIKADGKSVRAVRYFRHLPFINALEEDARSPAGPLIIIAVGFFLIYIINKGKLSKRGLTNN